MKPIHRIILLGALAGASVTASAGALAEDLETCRGGYGMMLMTPSECKIYLKRLQEVRTRADSLAELELQEWHTALLIERSQACPCVEGKYIAMVQHTTSSKPNRMSKNY
ncbi:MAG: hypothetical protein GC183_10535 [Thiobacillus sp.]|nr:hypothetical protein [Thiobacillus sp.]